MDAAYTLKNENPKKSANVVSKLFFAWILKLFYLGSKRPLKISDLYKTLECDKSKKLGDKIEQKWHEETLRAKEKGRKPSLFRTVARVFLKEYLFHGLILFFMMIFLRTPQPLLLSWLINQFQEGTVHERTIMYASASSLIAISILMIFFMHHNSFYQNCVGMKVRIAISSLVYRKVLKLNKRSQGQTAAGQVVNLLSNDVQRFDLVCQYLHYLWIMPIQVTLVAYVLWDSVGVSSLVGIFSMALCTLPVQGYLGNVASALRLKVAERTDARVKLMSEIISGIQVIKMYAWEKPFEKIIKTMRLKEVHYLTLTSYLRGFYLSCMVFIERSTLCLTLVSFALSGNHVRANIAFSMAQYFNILQLAMAIMYPMAISIGAETLVSLKRLEDFLILEEKQESIVQHTEESEVSLQGVSASWVPGNTILSNLEMVVPKGKLCAIVGPVGSGKSSLLQLLLGELPPTHGKIKIGSNLAYSSQEPWLFVASVRKNIMFGTHYDRQRYKEVTKVCALEKDFEQLPHGDKTMVGERGVSLSGGQRARINLARAIYREADVYLLDDPLSAVDTHVGKHLFDKCIVKYLKGKTRILVTHQLQYLKKADLIVVLNEGRIEAMGTFRELSNSQLDFTKMLASADETIEEKEHEQLVASLRKVSRGSESDSILEQTIHDEENEEKGGVKGATPFWDYLKSVNSICFLVTTIIILALSQAVCTCTDLWVALWTSQEEIRHLSGATIVDPSTNPGSIVDDIILLKPESPPLNASYHTYQQKINETSNTIFFGIKYEDVFDQIQIDNVMHSLFKTDVAIYFYASLILLTIILSLTRSFMFFKATMMASKNIHSNMFHCLLKAPMRFFDVNPSGRVLNRFSKDIGAIDEILPRALMESIQILLVMMGILVSVTISSYYMVAAIIILGYIFLKVRGWYVASAKHIKHIEGIAKSPVFSHMSSSLNGLTTIRASQAEKVLITEFDNHQDVHTSAWFLTIMCTVSFGLWLDIICVVFITSVCFGFVLAEDFGQHQNGSLVGLALSQSMILTGMLQYGMRQTAEVINQLTSVERVLQYTKLENEGPFVTPENKLPLLPWPSLGKIEFKNLSLFYSLEQSPVLKNLRLLVRSGEKIGIVGRTGAGKSSLISALFRLAPLRGKILIDGLDTAVVGLTDLRKKISIIPQEPVLFSSSLRFNLDPFNEFVDDKLWAVLEEVELKDLVTTLDFEVSEGGSNFSLGQRQLLCLARAMLRNNKVLVLDEATANVDARTDGLIQTTIRKKFKNCTVLTIAHRLNTVMDSDKVLVMDAGEIKEFGHPHKLLQMKNGHFTSMVMETGEGMTQQLRNIAAQAWDNRKLEDSFDETDEDLIESESGF
ncbi:unnamed protein product [Ceutorhynchus assimilis]|uniref:Uncharacterized protein n=1 Tax=Ceutorhynchus assimilis TaxID=467358 RepID=A0A9N9QJE3_9CUCU|nr:unnamed protein product [Ceutorhynchus assimilis]